MPRLVFDIETSAVGLENFDEAQQEYLFREAERQPTDEEKARKRAEISQQFSLWPFTAQVVCIAMVNADSGKGQVLYQAEDFDEESLEAEAEESGGAGVEFAPQVDEVELLTAFWDVARNGTGEAKLEFVFMKLEAMTAWCQITTLELSKCKMKGQDAESLAGVLAQCTALVHLDLRGNYDFGAAVAERLAGVLG
jgi:hypothetical protein